MSQKILFFLCDQYPYTAGEFFIDDETRVLESKFDKILILTAADTTECLTRFFPNNAIIASFSVSKLACGKIKSILHIFTPMFVSELFFVFRYLSVKHWFSVFKIMYVDIHRSKNLKKLIINLCQQQNIGLHQCTFYSYWHDYKALALAMLRKESQFLKCVARAHGWDNFADRHTPPYLPFKSFIINNLSQTYSISDAGKIYFEQYLNRKLDDKVTVSRLGKFNGRQPNMDKQSDSVLICSCSNLIPVKRVDKIIEVISHLQTKKIRWVHFGDGPLRAELEAVAANKLQTVEFEFRGIVANNKILDFYAENYVDLFINLSASEGIPVSIMEALSAGIPVVATDVGGTAEAVNSKNGFLVPENFEDTQVSQIIEEYLNGSIAKQQTIRLNAYNFWQENYEAGKNYETFAAEILSV